MDSYFTFFTYFDVQVAPDLASRKPVKIAPCIIFSCPHHSLTTFLPPPPPFFATTFFMFILYFRCLSPGIKHFIKELWFLLFENVFRKQDLSTNVFLATGVSCP
jgi:hypothetical protein